MEQERVGRSEAQYLLQEAPLMVLLEQAGAARRALGFGQTATFCREALLHYTNVCTTACSFCSFYRSPGHDQAFTAAIDTLVSRAVAARAAGATTVVVQGGHHPDLPFSYYTDLIAALRAAVPDLVIAGFSPPEVNHMAVRSGRPYTAVLAELAAGGLDVLTGAGADVLAEAVRQHISQAKIPGETWLAIMRAAQEYSIHTTATLTYGHRETDANLIDHLFRVRAMQDETGGFTAFTPWSYKPQGSPLGQLTPQGELPGYYLRLIAVSRLVLDNVPHVQAANEAEGWRVAHLALQAGADDFGAVLVEGSGAVPPAAPPAKTAEAAVRAIHEAGFIPVERDGAYRTVPRNHAERQATPDSGIPVIL
ncbi:MAG: radical SAM protein [Candidatus Hydrogenedentota bacterium]